MIKSKSELTRIFIKDEVSQSRVPIIKTSAFIDDDEVL